MNRAYVALFLLFLKVSLWGSIDAFFENSDPAVVHHVNVITGHLNLQFQDLNLKSPVPFSLFRAFTSAGVLEEKHSLRSGFATSLELSGGWTFFPHAHLRWDSSREEIHSGTIKNSSTDEYYTNTHYTHRVTLREKSGQTLIYEGESMNNEIPKLSLSKGIASKSVDPRKDPHNGRIEILKKEIVFFLPDGGKRIYNKYSSHGYPFLKKEILSSGHIVEYTFFKNAERIYHPDDLERIEIKSPNGAKTFASIVFDHSQYVDERKLVGQTSYGDEVVYSFVDLKERTYLEGVKPKGCPHVGIWYENGRIGTGGRFQKLRIGGQDQVKAFYNNPRTYEEAKKWKKNPDKVPFWADKVYSIQFPDPNTGICEDFACFQYEKKCTHVVDCEGYASDYYHDGEKITKVEHFDNQKNLLSCVEFEWKDDRLKSKTLLDGLEKKQISRRFLYDEKGALIEERTVDHIGGAPPTVRKFTYFPATYLLKSETEVGGLTHEYQYLGKTDLLTKKLTKKGGGILLREFRIYDRDHLLIRTIVDDGNTSEKENLTGVTYREIEELIRSPETGLVIEKRQKVLNLETQQEELLSRAEFFFSPQRDPIQEKITFGNGKEEISYVLHNTYDDRGELLTKTTPSGRVESFGYNGFGQLNRVKQVGRPIQEFEFDYLHRPKQSREPDQIFESVYDRKGRLVKEIGHSKNATHQTFDIMGRCVSARFPEAFDEKGEVYTPEIQSSYDLMGNLTAISNPALEKTETTYNAFHKPLVVTHPDGEQTKYLYDRLGLLDKVLQPDGSQAVYTYDPFERVTSKKILSSLGEILSEEFWEYTPFHLISHTNPLGLKTEYVYNSAGQNVSQKAGDRLIEFSYDVMGNLERVIQGGRAKVTKRNIEGEVVEEWEEAGDVRENYTRYFYDDEGRKEKAVRFTSQGEAVDHFFYDQQGRLISHLDPNGEETSFEYAFVSNEIGQQVEQKTTIDPLGLATVETLDANGRIVKTTKLDTSGDIVAKEELSYDRAGNVAKRVSTRFEETKRICTHTTTFTHDHRGRLLAEIEEGEKTTQYVYDNMGRLVRKTLPSGVYLAYTHDQLGRLLKMESSDGSVHYSYQYGKGSLPIKARDKVQGLTWERKYNIYGELIWEKSPNGAVIEWKYDDLGRNTRLCLPDLSQVHYHYDPLHLRKIERCNSLGETLYAHSYAQFDPNGHVALEELLHGIGALESTHDLLERPQTQSSPWHGSSLAYGPSGLTTSYENTFFGRKEYEYDPLNQLTREGERHYKFDSLGNPCDAVINKFNQIVSLEGKRIAYDENGCPFREQSVPEAIQYSYDAFNRVTSIMLAQRRRIQYLYDPFDRLYAKVTYEPEDTYFRDPSYWSRKVEYFIFDQDSEIGLFNEEKKITQLKVVGLGILGEIGGAVAIEIGDAHFAPIHDFCGNVIALIDSGGRLIESHDIDAFGKNLLTSTSINPWRFSSKRSEEHLVFYGKRFYSPFLGRFLTPDPAGAIESPNLYLFVRNSPLNRLDLFGLTSSRTQVLVRRDDIYEGVEEYRCRIASEGVEVDSIMRGGRLHEINFTKEEEGSGWVNILDHFGEIFAKDGDKISVVTIHNGIMTDRDDRDNNFRAVSNGLPGDPLVLCYFVETKGGWKDLEQACTEVSRIETPETERTRQFMIAVAESLHKVNSDIKWLHIAHSRGGAEGALAIEGMDPYHQDLLKQHMIWLGVAPLLPAKKELAAESYNFYSCRDAITGRQGEFEHLKDRMFHGGSKYNIEFLECTSRIDQMIFGFIDHSFLGNTYMGQTKKNIERFEEKYGFFKKR